MGQYSFQEVMRQFDRMCKAHAGCYNCPLHKSDSGMADECSIGAFVKDSERIEREIMTWATEHSEPVYPTWSEWLSNVGLLINKNDGYAFNFNKAFEPIPADIAQKLGIEPKEEQHEQAD